MSLLLDALKRAEQEKLARGDRPDLTIVQSEAPKAAPTPAAAPAAAATPLRDKSGALELQPLAGGPAGQAGAKTASPQAAQAVFDAKAAGPREDASRRSVIYVAAGTIVIALIAAAAYVWYAMQALAPKAVPPRAASAPAAPQPAAGSVMPIPPAVSAPPSTAAKLAPTLSVQLPSAAPQAPLPAREQLMQQLLREPAALREPPLRLERAQEPPRVPAEVASGYQALVRGDLRGARASYNAALAADATNVDALLGMATVEARGGNVAAAADLYRRTLGLDPRNQTALAGLASLAESSRPGAVEAQLRLDLASHPHSAALRLTLGNLLAAQSRWSEAQAEYFEAHRLDPGSPDIAHNLAVSLDHLGQARLAAEYYRRALAAAREHPAQFDAAPVERRLAELAP